MNQPDKYSPKSAPTDQGAGRNAALIDACRHGDPGALDCVLREHAPAVEQLIARLIGQDAELEDLVQQTLIAAVRAFPKFRGEASIRTWLSRIAVNMVRQHLRRPHRKRRVALELVPESAAIADHPTSNIGHRRALDRLFHHLDTIAPKKRIAFALHVFQGFSIEEVAALTGATKSATKSRVFWCRRALLRRARHDPELRAFSGAEDVTE